MSIAFFPGNLTGEFLQYSMSLQARKDCGKWGCTASRAEEFYYKKKG
jgi:hypothetical protein